MVLPRGDATFPGPACNCRALPDLRVAPPPGIEPRGGMPSLSRGQTIPTAEAAMRALENVALQRVAPPHGSTREAGCVLPVTLDVRSSRAGRAMSQNPMVWEARVSLGLPRRVDAISSAGAWVWARLHRYQSIRLLPRFRLGNLKSPNSVF